MTDVEPSDRLNDTVENIDYPDSTAAQAATRRLAEQAEPGQPAGSLGRLEELTVWLAGVQGQCPPRPFERSRLVLFAADHGIAEAGVSSEPAGSTASQLARLAEGAGLLNALAESAGVGVRLVELSVEGDWQPTGEGWRLHRPSGRIDQRDALTLDEVQAAIDEGISIADSEIEAGAQLLIAADLGAGNRTVAATLISILTDTEPIRVAGHPGELDDQRWMASCAAIRDARRRGWPHRGELTDLLAAVGGADLAAMTGFLLQAARRQTPVLLDGLVVSAAALVAQLASPRVVRWLQAAHLSPEPGHELALNRLGLSPIVELGIWQGQGSGALLVLPLVQAASLTIAEADQPDAGADQRPDAGAVENPSSGTGETGYDGLDAT